MPVTTPVELSFTKVDVVSLLVQVTWPVKLLLLWSLYPPVAISGCACPRVSETGLGVIDIDVRVGLTKKPVHPVAMASHKIATMKPNFRSKQSMVKS